MRTSVALDHRHRFFPAEIISHCVWLYIRFALSCRDAEEMLAMRGVEEINIVASCGPCTATKGRVVVDIISFQH